MANIQIQIALAAGQPPDTPRLDPGALLQGNVWVSTNADAQCRHLWVRVRWQTQGKGTRDQGIVGEHDLLQGMLLAAVPFTQSFAFPLPTQPWSYAGHYITIQWEVEVTVDLGLLSKTRLVAPFVMAGLPAALASTASYS